MIEMSRIFNHPNGNVSIEQINDREFVVYNHINGSADKRNLDDKDIWVDDDRRISGSQLLFECVNNGSVYDYSSDSSDSSYDSSCY